MKRILPIILLFPLALQAMHEGTSTAIGDLDPVTALQAMADSTSTLTVQQTQKQAAICISALLATAKHSFRDYQKLYFPTQDEKPINPLLPSKKTLTVPGATAIVKVTAINENAANINCTLNYQHTIKGLSNKNVEESVTREVTVNMGQEPTVVKFGDSAYQPGKEPSLAIPAESSYLAKLTLQMKPN